MTVPSPPDPLHEELWELVYGLLDEQRAAALVEQIRSDPALARRYAEVRLEADLLRDAARLELPCVPLRPPEHAVAGSAKARHFALVKKPWAWLGAAPWLTVAALLLLGIWRLAMPPAAPHLAGAAVELYGPPVLWTGQPASLALRALQVREPWSQTQHLPADIVVQVVDRQGGPLFTKTIRSQADGRAELDLPSEVIRPGVQLRVALSPPTVAWGHGHRGDHPLPDGSLQCDLPVEDQQWLYALAADPPQAPQRIGQAMLWRIDLARRQLVSIEPQQPSGLAAAVAVARQAATSAIAPAQLANAAEAAVPGVLANSSPPAAEMEQGKPRGQPRLKLAVSGLKERFQPGEEVRLVLSATDDQGNPVQATFAARVWHERWLGPGPAPLLAAQLPPAGTAPSATDRLAQALSGRKDTGAAQHSEAGRAGGEDDSFRAPSATSPGLVRLASSEELVRHALREAAQDAQRQAQHARWRGGLGLVALAAALALALVVWTALRAAAVRHTWSQWAPGLALVAASLLVAVWGWRQRPASEDLGRSLAMAPLSSTSPMSPEGPSGDAGGQAEGQVVRSSGGLGGDALAGTQRERFLDAPAQAAPAAGLADQALRGEASPAELAPGQVAPAAVAAAAAAKDRAAAGIDAARPLVAAAPAAPSRQPESEGAAAPQPPDSALPRLQMQRRSKALSSPPRPEAELPATLYFKPDLQADARGQVEISFTLPLAAGRYRLLVDAIGHGDVASAEHAIVCGP